MIKEGEKVKVDPRLTGLDEWIEGTVIDIEHNPFKGDVYKRQVIHMKVCTPSYHSDSVLAL